MTAQARSLTTQNRSRRVVHWAPLAVLMAGVVFFGTLGKGYGTSFADSVLAMGLLLIAVAALTLLLRAHGATGRQP